MEALAFQIFCLPLHSKNMRKYAKYSKAWTECFSPIVRNKKER